MQYYIETNLNADFRFFDQVVSLADAYSVELAGIFSAKQCSRLQNAIQEVTAPAFADIFAIRELLKLHYFATSELLLRPLIERAATVAYLRKSGESVLERWEGAWKNAADRPKLNDRINCMDELRSPFTGTELKLDQTFGCLVKTYKETLHSLVHGDRSSGYRSTHVDKSGGYFLAAGPNPSDEASLTRVSLYAASLTAYLLQELNVIFPELERHFLSKAS